MTDTPSIAQYFPDLAAQSDPRALYTVWVTVRRADGVAMPLDPDHVTVATPAGTLTANGPLPPVSSLFRGDRKCPEIQGEPPEELLPFIYVIERTIVGWCAETGTVVRDAQFEQLFTDLRRRPDGRGGPLFQYVRAAVQVALLLRPTSASEFDAVVRRLTRSARTFTAGPISTNYFDLALRPLLQTH